MQVQQCPECGSRFDTFSTLYGRRFCSSECRVAFQERGRRCVCEQCGGVFLGQGPTQARERRYCSRSCFHESRRVPVECVKCGQGFTVAVSRVRKRGNTCPSCE